MELAEHPERLGPHNNAFGFLRLLFASLVIVSHTAELIDGDRRRELMGMMGFAPTFGGIAVYGFFVISGYLITASYLNSSSVLSYLAKRVGRIYPGFVFASIICLVVVAPLAGAISIAESPHKIAAAIYRMVILSRPASDGAFADQLFHQRYVALNGAMWTIQYEFLCYLLVIALGAFGVFRRPAIVGALALALIALSFVTKIPTGMDMFLPATLSAIPQLGGLFLAGSCFYLIRDRITLSGHGALACLILLVILLRFESFATLGYAVFGSYLIFFVASVVGRTWLRKVNDPTDISYGVYLYGWPAQQLLMRYLQTDSLLLLCLSTLVVAMACGLVSWSLVEKPAMEWVRQWLRHGRAIAMSN